MRRPILAAAFLCLAAFVQAQSEDPEKPAVQAPPVPPMVDVSPDLVPPPVEIPQNIAPPPELPGYLGWMIHPLKKGGMFLNLPVIDTDPNRGVTVGFMPIWVIPAKDSDSIQQIHAPSFTYNADFGFVPTYRYYLYPTKDSSLEARASYSTVGEREFYAFYQDYNVPLFGRQASYSVRLQDNVDGSERFYGIGPDTPEGAQSDYEEHVDQADLMFGLPLTPESHWTVRWANHFASEHFTSGLLNNLTSTDAEFPGIFAAHRQAIMENRLMLDYDTRDSQVTTTEGQYLSLYASDSNRQVASQFDYGRYGFDAREFYKWSDKQVTAAQALYEQVLGNTPPFWLLPSLGGKYSLRAYGDGRFRDRGMSSVNVEQRFTVADVKMSGVATQFETGPFVGMGSVFDSPGDMTWRYERPVFGFDVRAVARPQVVGSIDVGFGQEGAAVFMDINYSY